MLFESVSAAKRDLEHEREALSEQVFELRAQLKKSEKNEELLH